MGTARELILTRRGLVFLEPDGGSAGEAHVRAVELELGNLGYVVSTRLRARLGSVSLDRLSQWRTWALGALAAAVGANRRHEPLFRSFPDGIPTDTLALWITKVLVHSVQGEDQPCIFCRHVGTTHVLSPCLHVVCSHCFDGASYSACPVCEHHVDRSSPFFKPRAAPAQPAERVKFKLLDLGESVDAEAQALLTALCSRTQALSPDDKDALTTILREYRLRALPWLPAAIPLRENVATVFGTLFDACDPNEVLPAAQRYMTTATDVLRFLAVISGADASLHAQTVHKPFPPTAASRWGGPDATPPGLKVGQRGNTRFVSVPLHTKRFKVARLRRPLRRALLGLLDAIPAPRLVEDMLRHQSYWVWVGEFLHPHEHADRFPNAARAFAVVRKKAPDGTPAPAFHGFYSRVEAAARAGDAAAMVAVLRDRPGELARRFDHALRIAGEDAAAAEQVVKAFVTAAPACSTPVLLTLRSALPTRDRKAEIRVYWPKGDAAMGVAAPDARAVLPRSAIDPAVQAIDAELLRRFAQKPAFADFVVDRALGTIPVPFNERTASRSAVDLPRGARVKVPTGKLLRLFLHWCEPEKGREWSDLDLSIGFYDEAWQEKGVCSYYQLTLDAPGGARIATSAGDLRDAPFPDGATELVDLRREAALAAGIRYAVMVVNNFAGMPFSRLERGFAGIMLRDDPSGAHFDPRTVALKFALHGENGIFMPLVLDVLDGTLHWLDVAAKGKLAFNNVGNSKKAITTICPRLMTYFASGVRPSMLDLALLHAAARGRRVFLRDDRTTSLFVRRSGEEPAAFHARLVKGQADEPRARPPRVDGDPVFAALYEGDVDLPQGSAVYTLFREYIVPTMAASDLLS